MFYATFGVDHPFNHYIQPIEAPDEEKARALMFSVYGERWCTTYPESKLADLRRYSSGTLPLLSHSLHGER